MRLDLDNLPSDMVLLHGLLRDMAAVVEHRDGEIERLQTIIKQLQRTQFGRRSERLDPDQLALGLEDLDSDIERAEASGPHVDVEIADKRPRRKPLADHLPREEVVIDVANDACPCCGGVLHSIGESVSEMLDWIPAQLRVLRITRPKYACRTCNTVAPAPAPDRPIAGGLATPALLAQVLVSKYCDHTPLYRQARIFTRHGVELERSTLAGWVGGACWWLEALEDRLRVLIQGLMVHCFPGNGRMRYGPGSPKLRHKTEAVRRAIQHSQESLRVLAKRYGINQKTVAQWKKRGTTADLPTGPKDPTSTSLSLEDEAIIVAFRQHPMGSVVTAVMITAVMTAPPMDAMTTPMVTEIVMPMMQVGTD